MSEYNEPTPKSTAHRLMVKGFRRAADRDRKFIFRGIVSRGKKMDFNIDWHQLPVRLSRYIVDTDGIPFFIVGLSIVGGGDKVRP